MKTFDISLDSIIVAICDKRKEERKNEWGRKGGGRMVKYKEKEKGGRGKVNRREMWIKTLKSTKD